MNNNMINVLIVAMSPVIIRQVKLKGIPLAPLCLKSYAKKRLSEEGLSEFVNITVKNFFISESSPSQITAQILAANPDIVCFSVYVWSYVESLECARIIKQANDKILIIFGGPQVSPIAKEVMKCHPYIDIIPYVVIPGEIVFYDLIKAIVENRKMKEVANIVYRTAQGELIKTDFAIQKIDYMTLPSPYVNDPLELIPGSSYTAVLEGTRGCPYDCGYCFYGRGIRKIQYFPLEKLLREIEIVYNHKDIKHVIFADSDMLLDLQRTEIVIKHILKQKSGTVSEFDINISHLNENIIKLLSQLPNYRFSFAVQTTNSKALENIGKLRPTRSIFFEKVKAFRQCMPTSDYSVDYMLGLPGDDLQAFKKTLDDCLSLEPSRMGLNYPLFLLPGTRFYEEKDILGLSYTAASPHSVVETKTFPKKDMDCGLRLAIWVEILTYQYAAIADLFFAICRGGKDGTWIGTLEKWIAAIDNKLNLFQDIPCLVDIAVNSFQEWNLLKGSILRRAADTQGAHIIYQTILELNNKEHSATIKPILIGKNVMAHLWHQGISSVEFSSFNELPMTIIGDLSVDKVKKIFSRYRK